jgi:hypothetical protein
LNEQQYKNFKAIHGEKNVTKYEKWVHPDELVEFDQVARVKGNLQDMINRYAGQFTQGVIQRTPITVIPTGAGNNKYCVKDGVTRGKAKKKALLTDPCQMVLISTFIHDTQGFSNDDWEDFQDSSNDHEGSSPSTELDMLDAMKRRLDSGRLAREVALRNNGVTLDPSKSEEVDDFVRLAGEFFVEKIFPNSGRTRIYFSNRITKLVMKDAGGTDKLKTHETEDLIKAYEQLGGTGYTQDKYKTFNKSTTTPETVYHLTENSRVQENLYGKYMKHYFTNPDNDFTVVISYHGKGLLTKDGAQIVKDRQWVVGLMERLYETVPIGGRFSIKSSRQIIKGEHEDKRGFTTLYDSAKLAVKANGTNKQQVFLAN